MKRIWEFLESIAFAGMKSGRPTASKPQPKWVAPLRGPIDRFLSGPAPTDPLYVTNRTLPQKVKSWGLIAISCAVLAVAIVVTVLHFLTPPTAQPFREPTAAELTAKLLPNLDKDFKLKPPSDVQVLEVRVDGSRLAGVVKNTSTREIAVVELIIDLVNSTGTQLGAVNGIVEHLPPSGNKDFQIPIKQQDATVALVREVNTR